MRLAGLRAIRVAKLVDYLLNDKHPDGGSKAKFFKQFGFDQNEPVVLESALLRHSADNEIWKTQETLIGTKSIVRCNIVTPDGRNPCILSIWFKPRGSTAHRLVSAYPAKAATEA